jgi:hypothetical protein
VFRCTSSAAGPAASPQRRLFTQDSRPLQFDAGSVTYDRTQQLHHDASVLSVGHDVSGDAEPHTDASVSVIILLLRSRSLLSHLCLRGSCVVTLQSLPPQPGRLAGYHIQYHRTIDMLFFCIRIVLQLCNIKTETITENSVPETGTGGLESVAKFNVRRATPQHRYHPTRSWGNSATHWYAVLVRWMFRCTLAADRAQT